MAFHVPIAIAKTSRFQTALLPEARLSAQRGQAQGCCSTRRGDRWRRSSRGRNRLSSCARPALVHGVYKDLPDYGVFCGEWCIGRIYKTRTVLRLRWFWALHAPSKPGEDEGPRTTRWRRGTRPRPSSRRGSGMAEWGHSLCDGPVDGSLSLKECPVLLSGGCYAAA